MPALDRLHRRDGRPMRLRTRELDLYESQVVRENLLPPLFPATTSAIRRIARRGAAGIELAEWI